MKSLNNTGMFAKNAVLTSTKKLWKAIKLSEVKYAVFQ